jgi:hypothetical protein
VGAHGRFGPLGKSDVVFAPRSIEPPWWVIGPALVAILGDIGLRFLRVAPLVTRAGELLGEAVQKTPTPVLVVLAAVPTLAWTVTVLLGHRRDEWWRVGTVVSAVAGVLVATPYLSRRRR